MQKTGERWDHSVPEQSELSKSVEYIGLIFATIWSIFKSISLWLRRNAEKRLEEKEERAASFLAFGERELVSQREEIVALHEENKFLISENYELKIELAIRDAKVRWTEADKDRLTIESSDKDIGRVRLIERIATLEERNSELVKAQIILADASDKALKIVGELSANHNGQEN